MSRTTAHLCAEPYCNQVIDGTGHCTTHQQGRSRSGTKGYGTSTWRRAREHYIAAHPDCEQCGKPGLDVDHIDGRHPLEPGANHPSNLMTLCRSCHRRKTEHAKPRQGWGGKVPRTPREQARAVFGPETALRRSL